MAQVLKILAQLSPAATTETTLYTVPASTAATVSTLSICNQNATAVTVRVATCKSPDSSGAAKNWLYYDMSIPANNTFASTLGCTLGAADIVRVYSSATNVGFQVFGVEVS